MVRAQISLEFITGVTIMLTIYVLTIGTYSWYTENKIIEQSFAEHICYKFSEGVDAAVIGGDGFSINISVPSKIYADVLNGIIVSNNFTTTVDWDSGIAACSIVTGNITGIWVYSGKISATNIDGMIYLTSINTDKLEYVIGDSVDIDAGYIKGSSANIVVYYSNGTLLLDSAAIVPSGNEVSYTWDTTETAKDVYTISVMDNEYKNLNARKEISVI